MSGLLLGDPTKRHEIHDDLESCFWVLLKISSEYFKYQGESCGLSVFDEYVASGDNMPATGGNRKKVFLLENRLQKTKWDCAPLNTLLHDLANIFREYLTVSMHRDIFAQQYQQKYDDLEKVDIVLECFDRALASDDWPTANDVVRDQPETASSEQANQDHRDSVTVHSSTTAEDKKLVM